MVGMKKLLAAIGLAAASSTTPSFAGNIWLTGHDAVLHCAFGGQQLMMDAYRHSVQQKYRFFSYGDCMLILP